MGELTPDQVRAMSEAVGLPIDPDDIAEVTHRLNAFLAALPALAGLPLDQVEPLPMTPPTSR